MILQYVKRIFLCPPTAPQVRFMVHVFSQYAFLRTAFFTILAFLRQINIGKGCVLFRCNCMTDTEKAISLVGDRLLYFDKRG